MLLIRRFEEKAGQLYGMGRIGGFCHLYIGQEAVVVGMQMAAKPGDQVITAYRDHGHALAVGMDPKRVMAELTGRRGGCSKGKGGSMHMFSPEKHFYGGHGIVGACMPLGDRARVRQPSIAATATFAFATSAMAPPTRARCTRPSTWRSCGSCRSCSSSRTTSTRWAPRSSARQRRPISPSAALSFAIPGEHVDGMDVRGGARRRRARDRACALGQWADDPGDAHLPLPRPLDVGPREVPHARGGAARARDV